MADLINISGGKQLAEFLNQLPLKIEKNIMRSALRAGASVIAKEAKLNAPVKTGNLKKSIRTGSNTKKGYVEAYIAAGGKKSKSNKLKKGAFYAQFIEYGTATHFIKPKNKKKLSFIAKDGNLVNTLSVNHPGTQAKPFMRPALDSKGTQAVSAVTAKIRARLTKHGINTPAFEGIDDVG
jgi:HK97 gp10 family phage protein